MTVTAVGNRAAASPSYAKKVWIDYMYGPRSMGASADDISLINDKYKGRLSGWQAQYNSDDENVYEIEDEKYDKKVEKGKQSAENKTDFDGEASNGSSNVGTGVNYAVGGTAAVAASAAGIGALSSKLGFLSKLAASIKEKGGSSTGAIVAAAIGASLLILAIYLNTHKPNKEAAGACETMRDEVLPEAQGQVGQAQADMNEASEEVAELSDEAATANDEANEGMAEKKAKFDMYITSFFALQEKAKNGTMTAEEKEVYQALAEAMKELGVNIDEIQADNTELIQELYDNMDTYVDIFDTAVAELGEVQGITDFAAGFDEDTASNARNLANSSSVAMVGAGAVVVAGGTAMVTAGLNWFKFGFGAAAVVSGGAALGVLSHVRTRQTEYQEAALSEITVRMDTQELNVGALEQYNTQIEEYDGYMQDTADLEMEVPDDYAAPEAGNVQVADPAGNANGAASGNGTNGMEPGTSGYQQTMGYGANYTPILDGSKPVDNNGEIIVNGQGQVVMNPVYQKAIDKVTQGKKLTMDMIPDVLAAFLPKPFTADNIRTVQNGGKFKEEDAANIVRLITGKAVDTKTTDANQKASQLMKKVLAFYYPIFQNAVTRGYSGNAQGATKVKA